MNVDRVGLSDGTSFREKKLPTVDLHSLTQETFPILHTPRDTWKAFRFDDYYETYRLINAYLLVLDQKLQ
jgi:Iap family predicted aminopeptidase